MLAHKTPDVPYISVLMSCYNAERWLSESILSILNQTYKSFEFIIVNDGSEDDTLAIIQKFAAMDSRIVVIDKPNTGLADSLNVGMLKAKGVWIARIDADDIADQRRLEKQVKYVTDNPHVIFLGSGMYEIDESGVVYKSHKYPSSSKGLISNLNSAQKFPPHSSAFYLKDLARALGGYRARFQRSQDRDLWLRFAEVGVLACINEPLVSIRNHPHRLTHEEAGRRQQIFSKVAIVSYWIRILGGADPLGSTDAVYIKFLSWIEARMEADRYFDRLAKIRLLKNQIHSSVGVLHRIKALISLCSNMRLVFWALKLSLFGDRFPIGYAKAWVSQQNSGNEDEK